VTNLSELELRQEILALRRRVQRLAVLLRLALVLLRLSGFTLASERLPDGSDKLRILRAIDQARACIPLRALLRWLRLSPSKRTIRILGVLELSALTTTVNMDGG
jgi:hypothetical protein